jgi:hypothetical protein
MGQVPWLAAVVPAELDPEALGWIRSQPAGVTFALHGWNHHRRESQDNEFYGYSREKCREILSRGLEKIGIPLRHFVAPFNGVTEQLLEACGEVGLSVVWGAPEPLLPGPRLSGRVIFVPADWDFYGHSTLPEIGTAPEPLAKLLPKVAQEPGVACIVLHIPWEASLRDGFVGVRKLAEMLRGRTFSPDLYVSTPERWRLS